MSNKYKCAVTSCQSENSKLFRCPESRNQLKKWKSILGVSENEFYVCELHFDANFVSYEKVLNDEAVPTIFINEKILISQYCACCSNPISEGHQIGQLHLEIYRMLFSSYDLNGEYMCTNCNDKMVGISDFIKIVEDNRKTFESMDVNMKDSDIKIKPPVEYSIYEEEESKPIENDSIYLKTEVNSDSELEYELESIEEQSKPKCTKNNKIKKCDICNYTNSNRDEFIHHIKSIHGSSKNSNDKEYDLQLEIDDPHTFAGIKLSRECDICREVFTDKQLLIEHFKAHFDKDRIYVCPFCQKNCKGIDMLAFHKNLDHRVKGFYCICYRTYDRQVVMKRCKKIHQNTLVDTKFVCDECDSYAAYGDSLRLAHHKTKMHGNGLKFWCTVCLKAYSNDEGFKDCIKRHRAAISQININCPDCNKTIQYSRFKGHQKEKHSNETAEICEICGLSFTSKLNLNNHKRVKHPTPNSNTVYECDLCGNWYHTKSYLSSHMNKHRYHELSQCTICLKSNLKKLDHHMKKFHPNNYDSGIRVNPDTNLFDCPKCVQNFNTITMYERHVKLNNCSIIDEYEVDLSKKVGSRTEGRFKCKFCKAVKKSIIRLKTHVNETHTGERQCPVCKKMYKNLRQLGKHVRNQHQMSMRDVKAV